MTLNLSMTDAEGRTLRELLADYLPALRLEVARTEVKEFRHHLLERQELCERLLGMLEDQKVGTS
jgi:hypothetical protein